MPRRASPDVSTTGEEEESVKRTRTVYDDYLHDVEGERAVVVYISKVPRELFASLMAFLDAGFHTSGTFVEFTTGAAYRRPNCVLVFKVEGARMAFPPASYNGPSPSESAASRCSTRVEPTPETSQLLNGELIAHLKRVCPRSDEMAWPKFAVASEGRDGRQFPESLTISFNMPPSSVPLFDRRALRGDDGVTLAQFTQGARVHVAFHLILYSKGKAAPTIMKRGMQLFLAEDAPITDIQGALD